MSLRRVVNYVLWGSVYQVVSIVLPVKSIPVDYRTKSFREDLHIFIQEKLAPSRRDRALLEERILPALAARGFSKVLFVGCRRYTKAYSKLFDRSGAEYWTTDIDPQASRWGEPGRHVTCDVRDLDSHFPPGAFDLVLLNGILGFGVDDLAGMERTVEAAHRVLRPGGILMIGYPHHVPDPYSLRNVRALFDPGAELPLPRRMAAGALTFDFLTARRVAAADRASPGAAP